jgi:colanic acid/amylovoran biosynthesis protein
MRLLIINQHTGNHGDEAAGKALLRALDDISNVRQIDILYKTRGKLENEKFITTTQKEITHHLAGPLSFFDKILIILSFLLPLPLVKVLLRASPLGRQYKLIKEADVIINAPSGINIGPYKDWGYLWRLYIPLKLNKPFAIYSISFGPIPNNMLFKSMSLRILKKAGFLSLRDGQSQAYAKERGIKYIPSIDTAFLDSEFSKELPAELKYIKRREYVVVVPNALYLWHTYYRNINTESLDKIYLDIIDFFTNKGFDVLLLPQLFGSQNDSKYFAELNQRLPNNRNVKIVPDNYSCDVQQSIINNSEFLVGARYHSIVFAIRGEIPFIALSYEHKMEYMLSSLSLDKYVVVLEGNLLQVSSNQIIRKIEDSFANRKMIKQELSLANEKSKNVARKTFLSLKAFLEDIV